MEALIRYHEVNQMFPETILVFRDGVSDSQMNTVSVPSSNPQVPKFVLARAKLIVCFF